MAYRAEDGRHDGSWAGGAREPLLPPTVAPNALIVAESGAAPLLAGLAEAAGLRVLGTVTPAQAGDRLAMTLTLDALVLDLRGHGARIAGPVGLALAGHPRARVLTIADLDGLDEALALLDGAAADWLCEPGDAELAGAMALLAHFARTGATPAGVREPGLEGERVPIETLSAEVRRLAEVIERLSGGLQRDPPRRTVSEGRRDYGLPPVDGPAGSAGADEKGMANGAALTVQALHEVLRARRLRDRFFQPGLFADPAWDIMLDLMVARLAGERVSVSSLCIAAAVPPTTALRWIRQLTDRGVLRRIDDPEDGRRVFIELGDEAAEGMARWWAAASRPGIALAPGA